MECRVGVHICNEFRRIGGRRRGQDLVLSGQYAHDIQFSTVDDPGEPIRAKTWWPMPKKIRELLAELKEAGFEEIPGGKGSHRKLTHPRFHGAVTLSGNLGDDAKRYQEKQVRQAIEEIQP